MAETSSPVALYDEAASLQALQRYGILDTPMEPAYDDLAGIAAHVCEAPVALISLLDSHRQWFKASVGLPLRETPLDQSVCRYAVRQPGVFIVPDLAKDARFAHFSIVTQENPLRFYAGAPLVTPDGYALGTLCVLDHRPRHLSQKAQDMLCALARQVIRLLELKRANDRQGQMLVELEEARRQMAVLAHTDVLTGLANRRSFTARLLQEQALLRRDGEPACLLMMDIDHFKRVNDAHGHLAGDQVLARFVRLAESHLRSADRLGRYGGEEFMVLLPETDSAAAQAVAERMRAALDATPEAAGLPHCTVSIGVTTAQPGDESVDALIARADAALYEAKAQGRNQVRVG